MKLLALLSTLLVGHGPADEGAPRITANAEPVRPGQSTTAPWQHLVVENCPATLAAARVQAYSALAEDFTQEERGSGRTRYRCYVPQALSYQLGPAQVRYSSYLLLNCKMALAMARFENALVRVTEEVFGPGATVEKIRVLGAYNCRPLRNGRTRMSQHAYGNAVDFSGFRVSRFGWVDVREHWGQGKTTRHRKASAFLHRLVEVLLSERVFANVLTPEFDAGHRNHLHVDLDVDRPELAEAFELDEPDWGREPAESEHEPAESPRAPQKAPRAVTSRVLDLDLGRELVTSPDEE
ncbi:MAG: extensin family protein [Myxococcales bacterium]|nr:extensin family protein [Myxococcales bacterium]